MVGRGRLLVMAAADVDGGGVWLERLSFWYVVYA